jgi:hypothetical protein
VTLVDVDMGLSFSYSGWDRAGPPAVKGESPPEETLTKVVAREAAQWVGCTGWRRISEHSFSFFPQSSSFLFFFF